MSDVRHAPISVRKREKRCRCGARFDTPQKLRRHVRIETADRAAEPTVWAAAPVPRSAGKRGRGL